MAKLQIFVLIVALSQAYGSVVISTLPGVLPIVPELRPELEAVAPELRPEILPEDIATVPESITPPCVASIRAILEAIIDRLPSIEAPRPLPVLPSPEVVPEIEGSPEVEVLPEPENAPEVEASPEAVETPCTACFEHINSLLTSAEKVLAVRRMATMLRI